MPCDLEIHELYRQYCVEPVLVIMNTQPKELELPIDCYYSVEVPTEDQFFRRAFQHTVGIVGASEAEEIGVEHLLRDIQTADTTTLSTRIGNKLTSLRSLIERLQDLCNYLNLVESGKISSNPEIICNIQEIFNLLPSQLFDPELVGAFNIEGNDETLAVYVGSMVRLTVGLHNLINNKLVNKSKKELIEKQQRTRALSNASTS